MKKVGICFSKELIGDAPLGHIVTKKPVYLRLLDMMIDENWEIYILTRKTYLGGGIFKGGWKYYKGNFSLTNEKLKIDLVFDRTGGISFPSENDNLCVINRRDFKVLAWDKWATYKELEEYMPKTFLLQNEDEIPKIINQINTEKVAIKPFNGLGGKNIFIGHKEKAVDYKFIDKCRRYVVQEFVDTSAGIPEITSGLHDLRIVIVDGKVVWSHVRVPAKGTYLSNAAQGGNLTEVDYEKVPGSIKSIVEKVSIKFLENFDNPIYSLDFGMGKDGPKIFEINDQMGFPKWDMKNRDKFLLSLVTTFKNRLSSLG